VRLRVTASYSASEGHSVLIVRWRVAASYSASEGHLGRSASQCVLRVTWVAVRLEGTGLCLCSGHGDRQPAGVNRRRPWPEAAQCNWPPAAWGIWPDAAQYILPDAGVVRLARTHRLLGHKWVRSPCPRRRWARASTRVQTCGGVVCHVCAFHLSPGAHSLH